MTQNINIRHKKGLSKMEKFALWITERIGTMGFFFIVLIWTLLWLVWNLFAPVNLRFDTVPAFALWLFISNILQLFFLPLIMVGQNLQGRHAELRAEEDFETNLKAEQEVKKILNTLEEQHEVLEKILGKIEKEINR
jgi:uncharacterized membrane protein